MGGKPGHLLYGAAYYDEYMPCGRLEQDIELMKKADMNVVRIAESTWSTYEPQNGVFDFSHVDRVLDAMEQAGIAVIVGTPTYAIPTWLVKEHPDICDEIEHKVRVHYNLIPGESEDTQEDKNDKKSDKSSGKAVKSDKAEDTAGAVSTQNADAGTKTEEV